MCNEGQGPIEFCLSKRAFIRPCQDKEHLCTQRDWSFSISLRFMRGASTNGKARLRMLAFRIPKADFRLIDEGWLPEQLLAAGGGLAPAEGTAPLGCPLLWRCSG